MIDFASFKNLPYEGDRGCARFAARVLAAAGIPYADVDRPEDALDWTRVERPQALDVVVFYREGRPGHVGVCVDDWRFIHVEEHSRSRIESLLSPLWSGRIEGVYRHKSRCAWA